MRPLRTASITPAKRKPWRSSIGARCAQSITRTPRRPTRPPSRCCYSLLARRPASQAEHEATRPTDCAETQSQRPTVRHGLVEDLYKRNTGIQATRPTVRAHPQSQRPNASSAAAVHATLDRPAVHATEDVQNIQLSMLAGPFARPSAPSPNPNAQRPNVRRPYERVFRVSRRVCACRASALANFILARASATASVAAIRLRHGVRRPSARTRIFPVTD